MIVIISVLWIAVRVVCFTAYKRFYPKREAALLLAYICIIVIARFTLYPFEGVDEPLVFNAERIFPLNLNLIPLVNILKHDSAAKAALNICGNIAMFIPVGVIWPALFKRLSTPLRAIASGAGFSLCIEIVQLPFRARVTDIDDLILNTLGFAIGYLCYRSMSAIIKRKASAEPKQIKEK